MKNYINHLGPRTRDFFSQQIKISFQSFLSFSSIIITSSLILAYILEKFRFTNNDGFIWLLVSLNLLLNLPYLRGIVASLVSDKINEETMRQVKTYVIDKIKTDPVSIPT